MEWEMEVNMAFGQTSLLTIDPGALPQATVISGLRPEVY
jgi:hypothetical protein